MTKVIEPKIEWNAKSIALLVVLCILVLGGIYMIGLEGDKSNVEAWLKQSVDWKAAPGRITELSITSATEGSLFGTNKGPWYPGVKYEYVVDNVTIYGEKIGEPKLAFSTEGDVTIYIQQFKVGDRLTVYFDPKRVTQSCLVKGVPLTADTKIPLLNQ